MSGPYSPIQLPGSGAIPVYVVGNAIPLAPITNVESLGYEAIEDLSTAQSLTVPPGATLALITVSGAAVRYRDDGVVPTADLGMPLLPGQSYNVVIELNQVKYIEQATGVRLDVIYYGPTP
jgi:hypothetical protein